MKEQDMKRGILWDVFAVSMNTVIALCLFMISGSLALLFATFISVVVLVYVVKCVVELAEEREPLK